MDRDRATGRSMRPRRTVLLMGTLSIVLIAAGLLPSPAGGAEASEFIPGSGQSYAQIYRAGPTAGRLSLAPIFGLSLADYLNTVGRGETKMADWAGIGVAERSLPDNTPFVKVSSTDKDSEKGETKTVGGAELFARATDAPLGESRYKMATFGVPALFEAKDSQSHTVAAVKNKVRESISTTDISELSIAAGIVKLRGLRWQSIQRTGAQKTVTGSFTIESAEVLGLPFDGSDLQMVIGLANIAVAPTGLQISLPRVEKRGGGSSVTPLSIDIVDSSLGRTYLAPVLDGVRPIREPVAEAFIGLAKTLTEMNEDVPDATVAILVADLTLGIFAGSSQLHVEMGGVSSFTEGEVFDNPFDDIDFSPPKVGGVQQPNTVTRPGTPGTPGTSGTPGSRASEPTSADGQLGAAPVVGAGRSIPGDKGGRALVVGLAGLLTAMGLATRDYWKMRQRRRAAEVA